MDIPIVSQVARSWWLVALRGVLSILFGVMAFVWPGITLVVLIAIIGAYMFVDGIFALVWAVRFRHERERWPMLMVEGILGIAVGVVTFLWPGLTAIAWLYTISAWAIVTGILEIVTAIRLRKALQGDWLLALTGVASIVLGIAFALMPLAGLLAWVWVIGAYAIVFGILLVSLAFRLRGLARPGTTVGVSAREMR
ncbi:MAG: HdeD family acid-resistance protein [Vulcanimicrobiaceae bacterium]